MFSKLTLLLLGMFAQAIFAKEVILTPPSIDASKNNVGIIYVQGAGIAPEQYQDLMTSLQNTLGSDYNVWVGIPQYLDNSAPPPLVGSGVENMMKSLTKDHGMPDNTTLIGMGHSLGGASLQSYSSNQDKAKVKFNGQVLMGAFIQRQYLYDNDKETKLIYPVPTLTIGAELDGLCRITRITESFYRQIEQFQGQDGQDELVLPVVAVSGMSHMQFASGNPPSHVKKTDLKPEITDEDAHNTILSLMSSYIQGVIMGDNDDSKKAISDQIEKSKAIINPVLAAMTMEGSYYLKKPCYDETPSDACNAGCPWTNYASQKHMSGLPDSITINNNDGFHPVDQTKPTVHLPHILNNCTSPDTCTELQTVTVTEAYYDNKWTDQTLDTGSDPLSAGELRTKLSSRQRSMEHAGYQNVDFDKVDAPSICAEINQMSWDWAMSQLTPEAKKRYDTFGEPYIMGEDKGPYNAGPLWINKELVYKESKNDDMNLTHGTGYVTTIQSVMMKTPTDYFLSVASGFHYCKILSPARAMEWMIIDSLRKTMGINN